MKDKVIMMGTSRSPGAENSAIDYVDDGFLEIMGEKYRVSGYYKSTTMYMFWGTQPENTLISGLSIRMKNSVTEKQSDEIMALYNEIFGEIPLDNQELPETYDLLEIRADAELQKNIPRRKHQEGKMMIKLRNITKIYNPKKHNQFVALRGISLEIADGDLCAIIGKSGS